MDLQEMERAATSERMRDFWRRKRESQEQFEALSEAEQEQKVLQRIARCSMGWQPETFYRWPPWDAAFDRLRLNGLIEPRWHVSTLGRDVVEPLTSCGRRE